MFRSLPFLLLLGGLPLAAAPTPTAPLVGRMDGESYVSPTAQFRIRAPVLPELGGVITDNQNVVTFQDSFGTHASVACFPLDASQRWELDTRGRRDYLLYFFTDVIMVNFTTRFPGSRVESARYLPALEDGALIGYSLLPGGSHFEQQNRVLDSTPPADPVTAKRGTLVFVRNRHVYALSIELAERATQRSTYKQTVEQENDTLSARLTALHDRMSFSDERPRPPWLMPKSELLARIVARLQGELDLLTRAALATHAEATDEENKAEDKYDTRGLEASYLAHGQSKAAEEAALAVAQFQSLALRDFAAGEPISLGALVSLDDGSRYFIGPRSGGTEVEFEGATVMVITPQSPLGRELVGRRKDDRVTLTLGRKRSELTVTAVV